MDNMLTVLSDLSERIHYNLPDYPLYINEGDLRDFGYMASCHWHPDLEFIYIVSGTMDYFINGQSVRLEQGQGLFVNSVRLHYGFSNRRDDCEFYCICVHPTVYTQNTKAAESIFDRKFGMNNEDFLILYPHIPWQYDILESLKYLYGQKPSVGENPVPAIAAAMSMVDAMAKNMPDAENTVSDNNEQVVFLNMVKFIQDHYAEKLPIDDIAEAGHISRSKAYRLFDQYTQMSPNSYVLNYRIAKSIELLRDTNLSVLEISSMCGFSTPSYFTNVFRREYGVNPREFRKQLRVK